MKKIFSLLVLAVLLAGCLRSRGGPSGPVSLTFYGLDDSDVFESLIHEYRGKNPKVSVKYKKFADEREFEDLLINEIAEGEGPDIFYLPNTWLPRHTKKLVPLVSEQFTPKEFSETFVKVAADDFLQPDPADANRKIYAMPLFVDTLALYFNKEHFEKKLPQKGKPAETWDGLKDDAPLLREERGGVLERGALGLGRGDNIHLAPDILYHLFLQAGADWYDPDFKTVQFAGDAQESFDYFLSFGLQKNKNYSWGSELAGPQHPLAEEEAFLAGRVSAIFGYSDLYPRLANDLKNVKSRNSTSISLSDVGVARSPQISSDPADFRVLAKYSGLGVSRNSKNPDEAWRFVQFVTSKNGSARYHEKTGRPTARRDLIEDQKKEPVTDVFVSQLGYAGSYRLYSWSRFSDLLRSAVQASVNGQTSRSALSEAQTRMNETLKLEAPEGLYPKPKKKK